MLMVEGLRKSSDHVAMIERGGSISRLIEGQQSTVLYKMTT